MPALVPGGTALSPAEVLRRAIEADLLDISQIETPIEVRRDADAQGGQVPLAVGSLRRLGPTQAATTTRLRPLRFAS
jgi:hypothetical protein